MALGVYSKMVRWRSFRLSWLQVLGKGRFGTNTWLNVIIGRTPESICLPLPKPTTQNPELTHNTLVMFGWYECADPSKPIDLSANTTTQVS